MNLFCLLARQGKLYETKYEKFCQYSIAFLLFLTSYFWNG
jgi:hypothetical protein